MVSMPSCCDCGKTLKDYRSVRCRSCGARAAYSDKPAATVLVSDRHREAVERVRWCKTSLGYAHGRPFPNGPLVYLHRYVWLLEYGEWPSKHLDHINRNPEDNRIENLRLATVALNMRNRSDRKRPAKYPRGVRFKGDGRDRPYQASITRRGACRCLGHFATPEEAAARYEDARQIIEEFEALEALG